MGVRLVSNQFPQIIASMPTKADAAVDKTADEIVNAAKSMAPVDTGALRDAINSSKTGQARARVSADIRYAAFVEYGTAEHGGPQPFMTPAAHQAERSFVANIQDIFTV